MNWAIETIYIILSVSLWMPTDDRSEQNWTILYRGYSMIILWYLVYMILSLMIFILFIPPLSKFSQSESAIPNSINIGYLSIYHSHSVYKYVDFRAFFSMYYKSQHKCTRLYWHIYISKICTWKFLCDVIFWILTLWYIIKCKHEFILYKNTTS